MDKIWVKDVKEGERVKSLFLVARKAIPTAKSGKTYLAAVFQDRTGELEARAFDRIDELGAFEVGDLVEVEGLVGVFQGRPQLRIEALARVDPAAHDAAEFAFVPPPEPRRPEPAAEPDDAAWKELLVLVDAVTDPHIKGLIASFLGDEDFAARLRRAPAAKTVHHAYAGGLLEHTVSTIKLAHRLADHYPQVDRDLLVAGAFLHDLGKVRELAGDRNAEYTDEGKLVGHLVMTAQWVHERARRIGVPRELEHHLVHLVLAHHGELEYGSPKAPATLEALLTHYLDEIDSRVNSWLNLMGREGGSRRWTDSNNVYEVSIWRGALPTVQAEKHGPPAEAMTPVIYVPRQAAGGQPGSRKKGEKRQRPVAAAGERRPEPRPSPRPSAEPVAAEPASPDAPPRQEPAPAAPRRDHRPDHPDRGGSRGPFVPGDRKKGYTGPRLPGDKGPHRPQAEKKSLTHNPFAALAAKLAEGAAPAPAEPRADEPAAAAPAGSPATTEPTPPAPTSPAVQPPSSEDVPGGPEAPGGDAPA